MSKALILLCVIAVLVGPAVSQNWPACTRLLRRIRHEHLEYIHLPSLTAENFAEPIKYARGPKGNTFYPVQTNEKPLPEISILDVPYKLQTLEIHNLDIYRTPTASAVVQVTLFATPSPSKLDSEFERLIVVVPFLEDDGYRWNKLPTLQRDLEHLLALGGEQSYETNLDWLVHATNRVTILGKPPIDNHGYDEERTLVVLTACININLLPLASLFPSYCDSD